MADDTKVIVSVEAVLKGLGKTLQGLGKVEKTLQGLAKVKLNTGPASTASLDRAALSTKKFAAQSLELANRLERARQISERLALAQERLAKANARANSSQSNKQADAQAKAYRDAEKAAEKLRATEVRLQKQAAQSLQRQRSSALITDFKAQERAATKAATTREREAKRAAAAEIREAKRAAKEVSASQQKLVSGLTSIGSGLQSFGQSLTLALTAPLAALSAISIKSATSVDAVRNRLIATEGSIEAANARLEQLRKLADESVGVTRGAAQDAFALLSTVGDLTEDTINRQIKAIGRLNAAFSLDDQKTFFRNLTQIFQQGFERQDIKQALGTVPIFEQLLEQAFGTKDASKLKELKDSGKLTLDTFLAGFAGAVESNPVLGRIGESVGTRLAKTFERVQDALAPLGDALLGPLEKIINVLEPLILKAATAFNNLSPGAQTAAIAIGAFAAAIGPALFATGVLAQTISNLIPVMTVLMTNVLPRVITGLQSLATSFRAATVASAGFASVGFLTGATALFAALAVGAVIVSRFTKSQRELATVTEDQVKATKARAEALGDEVKFLNSLEGGIEKTADQQKKLASIYEALDARARVRIKAIDDEAEQAKALTAELQRLAQAEGERLKLQGATIAAKFAQDLQKENDLLKEQERIQASLVKFEQQKIKDSTLQQELRIQGDQQSIADAQFERASALNKELEDQNKLVREGARSLKVYEQVTGTSSNKAIEFARNLGQLDGITVDVTEGLNKLTKTQGDVATSTDEATDAIKRQISELDRLATSADAAEKERRELIKNTVAAIRENSTSTADAKKQLEGYIKTIPKLGEAIEKERQGQKIEDFLNDLISPKQSRGGGRTKESQLTQLLNELKEKQIALLRDIEDGKIELQNDTADKVLRLLQQSIDHENTVLENQLDDRLVSIEKFYDAREKLQLKSIDAEIAREKEKQAALGKEQARLLLRIDADLQRQKKEIDQNTEKLSPAEIAAKKKIAAEEASIKAAEVLQGISKDSLEIDERITKLTGDRLALETQIARERKEALEAFQNDVEDAINEANELSGNSSKTVITEINRRFGPLLEKIANENGTESPLYKAITELVGALSDRARIQELINRSDIPQQKFELEAGRAQSQVADGLKSEREARQEINALQRKYAEQQLIILNRALQIAKDSGLEQEQLRLEQLILRAKDATRIVDEVGQQINRELFSDLEQGFTDIFTSARKGIEGVKDALISLGERLLDTINKIAAQSLTEELFGKIFKPDSQTAEGTPGGFIAKLFGLGPKTDPATDANTTATDVNTTTTDANTQALNNLTTTLGGQAAIAGGLKGESGPGGLINTVGSIASGVVGFVSSLFGGDKKEGGEGAGGGGFLSGLGDTLGGLFGAGPAGLTAQAQQGSTVIQALNIVSDWLAKVVDALKANTEALGASSGGSTGFDLGSLSEIFAAGAAKGDFVSPQSGGRIIRVAEGGYPEAVLTTDPRYAPRQANILSAYLARARGVSAALKAQQGRRASFNGLIPRGRDFAAGGFALPTPRDIESNMLDTIASGRSPSFAATMGREVEARDVRPTAEVNLRNIIVEDMREVENWLMSSAGERVLVNAMRRNVPSINNIKR